MSFYGYPEYVPVAERRAQAARKAAKLAKKGHSLTPVRIDGRKIATSFWGKAWCDNLERYSDFESRLPRGRTYVRNGSVIDLKIERGAVSALVSGSDIYKIRVEIAVASPSRWKAICTDCSGSVGSLVELLQGKLSKNVMERVCREGDGLFPAPGEIKLKCSCPDWADMCKHVAAVLYGVGARLDASPELLFTLRGVDRGELIASGADLPLTRAPVASGRVLADDDISALFGIEMTTEAPAIPSPSQTAKPVAAPRRGRPPGGGKTAAVVAAPVKTKARAPKPIEPPQPTPSAAKRKLPELSVGRTRAAKWIGARARKAQG